MAPWDEEAVLASARKTGRLLIAHEAVERHGLGAEIAAVASKQLFGELSAPVKRIGAPFAPVPFSKPLEDAYAPNAARIAAAAQTICK